ncbi:hypothetical protein AK88_04616 [Plasmodium fragile]|uniref:Schizont-infected cell agglutination C-terminal domain-containing protein n=1 Tax=Plasmodium fragile TaxID=5857 RepID=A0A0D9QJ50_PLAFR|nr:uncharacterized protein AK88_04616 [Plasmodium fragile]KJP85746.1 hypothetical protein AK88_04616 [Plasmodium fragile]
MAPPGRGGGGGGGTARVPGGGGKEHGKAGKGQDCAEDRAQQRPSKTLYVVPPNNDDWNKWKTVLEDFKEYMDAHTDLADAIGANCYNSGWNDFGDGKDYHTGQTVADVVRCRVMSTAWAFANGWDMPGTKTHTDDRVPMDTAEENRLRCEVANIFGHLLKKKYCTRQTGFKRGVEYSRIVFRKMNSPGTPAFGALRGPVIEGKCTACGYDQNKRSAHAINLPVVEWLLYEGKILQGIENIEGGAHCTKKWEQYTKGKTKMDNPKELDEEKITEIKPEQENLRKKATKKMDEVKEALEKKIQEMRDKHMNGTKPADGGGDQNGKKPSSTSPSPGSTGHGSTREGPRSDTTAGEGVQVSQPTTTHSQPQAPASPVLPTTPPARPPPPPPPGEQPPSQSSSASGSGTTVSKDTKDTGKCTHGTKVYEEKNVGRGLPGANSRITISFATTAGTDGDCDKKSKDTGADDKTDATVVNAGKDNSAPGPTGPPGTEAPTARAQATTPGASADVPPAGGTNTDQTQEDVNSVTASPDGQTAQTPSTPVSGTHTTGVVNGANDDPPPLNPPKPKPNPDPNQSGSSGVGGGTEQGTGGGGGTGGSYSSSGPELPPSSPGQGTVPSTTTTGAPTPSSGTETTSTGQGGDGSTSDNQDAVDSGKGGHVEGGNDDPPPLNPPKPKPNPNPDQSGTTGSGPGAGAPSSGGGAHGVSGREGKGGAGDGGGGAGAAGAGAGSTGPVKPNSSGTDSTGHGTATTGGGRAAPTPTTPSVPPGLTWDDVKWYTPALIPAVVGIGVIAFFLWKYFAYLAKRRRTYRTLRDVPSPPLDEDILDHLQRAAPPPDYGYTMIQDRQPASAAARRRRRPPRVHRRTIIDLHLEVLNECEAAAWEHVKDDYLQIVLQEFAQECAQELMREQDTTNNILGVPTSHAALATHDATTRAPPTHTDGTDPCPPNEHEPDAWSCMDTMQLATDRSAPHYSVLCAVRANANSAPDHINWITWIDRNKYLLRACTTQPWFLQLKANWKQHVREHMAADEDHGQRAFGEVATLEMRKLRLWKAWVAKQHDLMNTYSEEQWFQHLLNSVEEETVPEKGDIHGVEHVMAAEDMLRLTHVPRSQPLHPQLYMTKPLTAQTWILILALVIEQCEIECRLQETELYVDDLLQQLRH